LNCKDLLVAAIVTFSVIGASRDAAAAASCTDYKKQMSQAEAAGDIGRAEILLENLTETMPATPKTAP